MDGLITYLKGRLDGFGAAIVRWVRHWEKRPLSERKPQVLVLFGLIAVMMSVSVFYSFKSSVAVSTLKRTADIQTNASILSVMNQRRANAHQQFEKTRLQDSARQVSAYRAARPTVPVSTTGRR